MNAPPLWRGLYFQWCISQPSFHIYRLVLCPWNQNLRCPQAWHEKTQCFLSRPTFPRYSAYYWSQCKIITISYCSPWEDWLSANDTIIQSYIYTVYLCLPCTTSYSTCLHDANSSWCGLVRLFWDDQLHISTSATAMTWLWCLWAEALDLYARF